MDQSFTESNPVIEDLLQRGRDAMPYLDIAGVMIGVLDTLGIVRFINKKGSAILGLPENDIIGADWIERFVPADQRTVIHEAFANIIAGNATPFEYYENEIIDAQGNRRIIAFHNELLHGSDNAIIGVLFSGEDITRAKKLEVQLIERTNLLEAIGENLPIGYAVNTISDEKFVTMNQKFQDFYGWPKDIITNVDQFFEHVYPDPVFRKKIEEQVRVDMMSADPRRMIWENIPIVRQSGETAYISAQNIPLYENDLMISTVWDVSRQVAIEKELKESHKIQKAIIDNIPDVAWVKDKEGKVVLVNDAFAKAINKNPDEIIGKTDLDLWDNEELAKKYVADDMAVMEARAPKHTQEYMIVPGTDTKTLWETFKSPVYNEDGSIFGTTGISRMLMEKKSD